MEKLLFCLYLVGSTLQGSIIAFSSISSALYGCYYMGFLDFNSQLHPMLNLTFVISALVGLIYGIHHRLGSYDFDLLANNALIPAKFFPSSHSRNAPPAVDV